VIANNVSDAYTKAVRACGRYVGVATDGLFVTLNTQFDFAKLSPEQIDRLVSMWQSGVITFGELREQLVESEFANIESAIEAKEIIEQENAAMIYDSE
jgi:Asp-tRNA(Asn)/Glu-tRNA(Gln) amidotransferase B subunit